MAGASGGWDKPKKPKKKKGPSGFLGRAWAVATGIGGAANAPMGLVKDLAFAPFTDDEFGGVLDTLVKAPLKRGGDVVGGISQAAEAGVGIIPAEARSRIKHGAEGAAAGGLIGAGVGAPFAGIGAIPGALAGAAGGAAYGVGTDRSALEDLETVGREAVREPLSAAFTAGSLASRPGHGMADLFESETWQEAYKIAQDRSVGQSFALMFLTKDVTNDDELARAVGSTPYSIISTTTDAVARLALEPDILAARSLAVAGLGRRLIVKSADDINEVARAPGFHKFIDALEGKSSTEIRNQHFPHDAHGAGIADALAHDPDPLIKTMVARAFMGDEAAKKALTADRPALASRINRLTAEESDLHKYADESNMDFDAEIANLQALSRSATSEGLHHAATRLEANITDLKAQKAALPKFDNAERLATVKAELDEIRPEAKRLARLEAIAEKAPLREIPSASKGHLRAAITRSEFYLESPFAAPLRATFEMVPARWVNLHDATSDIHLARNLESSPFPQEVRDQWRNQYMAATSPAERGRIIAEAETAAVKQFAEEAGMTVDELEEVMQHAARGRGEAQEVLRSRAYDGKNRSMVQFVDDDGLTHEVNFPLFITQEVNFHVLVDLHKVKKATQKIGAWKARHPGTAIPADLSRGFYRLWKPAVLLRGGWPVRIVTDEQLRIMAKIGVLAQMKNLKQQGVPELTDRMLSATARKVPVAGKVGRVSKDAVDARARARYKGFEYLGYEIHASNGTPGDASGLLFDSASSAGMWKMLLGRTEDDMLKELREKTGQYVSQIAHGHKDYAASWEHAVNKQFGQDVIGKKILDGESTDDIVRWMNTTEEGHAAAMRFPMPGRGADPTHWVEAMAGAIEDYSGGSVALKRLMRNGTATADDLAREIPDAAMRPVVHGEIIEQLKGGGVFKDWAKKTVRNLYDVLGRVPTDVLSRNPYFDDVYQAEVKRLVRIAHEQSPKGIGVKQLRNMEHAAREYALRENKELLYDLAEESRLSEMLSHIMPFYSAWQEVGTRWAGLAMENPAFIMRMKQAWLAPERAGLAVDERGWELNASGKKARDPNSGLWVEAQGETSVVLRLPEWAQGIPGLKQVGEMTFRKDSANLLLQGGPGFGPPVQFLANEIAKHRPDLEASMKFVLPFGVTQSWRDILLPSTAKRGLALAEGEESRQFANSTKGIYLTMVTDRMLGKRFTDMTDAEFKKKAWGMATKDAQAFWGFRTFVSWTSPVAMQFNSPYQAHIEVYRGAQARLRDDEFALGVKDDGSAVSADEWFLDTYGEEFFALTTSMSKSNDGVPPTMEGYAARKKYKDLIEEYPELGNLIIGSEGAGEYSNFVYQSQMANPVRPGSGTKQRRSHDFEEVQASAPIRLGWIKYGRFMDLIDAERIERGLPSLNVKAAEDLHDLKAQVTEKLGELYPEWKAERLKLDTGGSARRLEGMRKIAADKRLAGRKEIDGLATYLKFRDLVTAELANRKAKTLDATSNMDLAETWDAITAKIVEENLPFASLYHRYLEGDQLVLEDP